jgi:hypothetical integral membrane protein (TIGR02206 family)
VSAPVRPDVPPAFVPFGGDHLAALAATGLTAIALCLMVRREPKGLLARVVRASLAMALALATALTLYRSSQDGPLSIWDFVPLHLCDFLILVAILALLTDNQLACELLYFWGGAGTLVAMLSPDVGTGFPDWRFLAFFGLHGLVVVSAAVLTLGVGRPPRPGSALRVFVVTNAYAAVVGLVDAVFAMNFLYLREKPRVPTVLDRLGPWPIYLGAVDLLALALFLLLELPFRRGRRAGVPEEG